MYYFGVRYYAAWLGRWTSSDPADFIDGLNLYRYVRNNPVNLVDADGRSSDPPNDPPIDPNGNAITLPEGSILGKGFSGDTYSLRGGKGTATPVQGSLWTYQTPTSGGGWLTHTAHFNVETGAFTGYKAGAEQLDADADAIRSEQIRAEESERFMSDFNIRHAEAGDAYLKVSLFVGGTIATGGAVGLAFRMLGAGAIGKEALDFGVDTVWELNTGLPSPFILGFSDMAEIAGKSLIKKTTSKLEFNMVDYHKQLENLNDEANRFLSAVADGALPGKQGAVMVDGYQGEFFARELMNSNSKVEFGLLFNSKTKTHTLYSGTSNRLEFPQVKNNYLLWHTHPNGTATGSIFDRGYLIFNPQLKNTRIIPKGKKAFSFNLESKFVGYQGNIITP